MVLRCLFIIVMEGKDAKGIVKAQKGRERERVEKKRPSMAMWRRKGNVERGGARGQEREARVRVRK